MSQMKDLYDFLVEAELQHYYNSFQQELKVTNVSQLKYVEDDDLVDMGMTKPEIRRLKKFFKKECPQGTFGKLKKRIMTKAQEGSSSSQSSGSPQLERVPSVRLSSSKHVISESAISLNKVLGNGEFGTVQQGVWVDDDGERIQVAVKCLCKEKVRSGTPDFLKEASIMHTIDHMYIVRLYGVVLKPESLWLVTELAPLRSLLECLKEPALRPSFPVIRLCDFCVQIASGMQYLETKRLIHRDLAARNILVFAKNKVKISDFGLSRALGVGKDYYQTNFSVNLKLPIAWCAPECINYLKFTSASDVWAYGVTIWEMFSYGFQPWAALTGQQILDAIDEPHFERLELPESCPKAYYDIMTKCWQHDPKQRPTFNDLLPALSQATPDQVKATADMSSVVTMKDFLQYKTGDVITVLDKQPANAAEAGLWKGILPNGKVGLFKASDATACQQLTPVHKQPKSVVARKVSSRKSTVDKKLSIAMISGPQDDMRHTGHVGFDGTTFGDVAFIVDNYDKLPKKIQPGGPRQNDVTSSSVSLPTGSDAAKSRSLPINGSQSETSVLSDEKMSQGGSSSMTGLSMTSHEDTLTDVSSVQDGDSSPRTDNKYEEINDDDLDNFKMPELSTSLSFDLGPSFMDEVMRAITEPKKETVPETDETSPLIEKDIRFPAASFDNIAMSRDMSGGHDTSTDTETDTPREDGVMESCSSVSSKTSDEQKKGEDHDRRKHRHKQEEDGLEKVSASDREPHASPGMKQMSASEEKKIDEAIELVNEFAQISTAEDMNPEEKPEHNPDVGSPGSSPRQRSLFSLRKKTSPKPERTFSDEIANLPRDLNEEVTPEAQEVYNMLVVRGSLKDDGHRLTREMRARRSLEHQERDSNGHPPVSAHLSAPVTAPVTAKPRNINMNIRAPAGIPGRSNNARNASRTAVDPDEMDTNPLRRLRHIQVVAPRFRAPRTTDPDPKTNGHDAQSANLNPNMQFFAKLHEQERESEDVGTADDTGSADCTCPNDIPLPPRRPLRPSVTRPPRQRKYPLDLSSYGQHHQEDTGRNGSDSESHVSVASLTLSQRQCDTTRDTDDGVFSGSDSSSILEPKSDVATASPSHCLRSGAAPAQFSVKSVSCSAAQLGLFDNKDSFWSQKVNFDEMAPESDSDLGEDSPAMSGRYKTSDNVSYEDLLEFALDGAEKSKPDENCDEVRLMRKVLSRDVTVEDCMYALQETDWDVFSAIKLLKLKQLLSTKLGAMDECKDALLQCQWDVQRAANQLLTHEPDLVHV